MHGAFRSGSPWSVATGFGLAALVAFLAPPSAHAGSVEYCVTCKNPNASYRCRLQGSGVGKSDALKLYCVVRTTKEGGHASCSAKQKAGCTGVVKVYQYDGPTLPENLANDPRVQKLNKRVNQDNRAFENNSDDDKADSLFELGGKAYDASKRGIGNAGAAIGLGGAAKQQSAPPPPAQTGPKKKNFAKRGFDCMMSLFRNCDEYE